MANSVTTTPTTGVAWASSFASLLQLLGNMQQGRAARAEAERAKASAEFSAWMADQQAGQAMAASQRRALEERRIGGIASSRILAVAAAAGGGATDPTITNLIATQASITAYKASVAIYEGESNARMLRLQAASGRVSGAQAVEAGVERETGYKLAAAGSAVKGGYSLYAKYGGGGPGQGDAALLKPTPGVDE